MDCPRCKLALRAIDYEGVAVDSCDGCWGFWFDKGELEDVLERHELVFSDQERRQILDVRKASRAGVTTPAACPRCQILMRRIHFDESVHLVIDQCPDHGVWLDTGEVKRIQALADGSEAVHRLLIRKLGLKPAR